MSVIPSAIPDELHELHRLLISGFLQDKTSYAEKGNRISLKPKPKESVLVYQIDKPEVANTLGLASDRKCDALILYVYEPTSTITIRVAAIELKGNDHCHAVEQIATMLRALKKRLPQPANTYVFSKGILRAFIVSSKGSPQQINKDFEKFNKEFKFIPKHLKSNDERTLRSYLRASK